jgi:hypothetical protein
MAVPNVHRAASLLTAVTVVTAAALAGVPAAGEQTVPVDLPGLLARIGDRVEAYYARAQSIVYLETVRVQRMSRNLTPEPFMRVLAYELRVQRDAAIVDGPPPEPNVLRQLKTVNGRVPKPNQERNPETECFDPKETALDSLSFLLPHHQGESRFSYKGGGRLNGRAVAIVDYAPVSTAPVSATWIDGCASFDAPSHTTGRIWIDTAAGDVVRIDERVRGPIEIEIPKPQRQSNSFVSVPFEFSETSIRYKTVAFSDPDETCLLPESVESLSVVSGPFLSTRITHTFTGYQRFVTGARVIQ